MTAKLAEAIAGLRADRKSHRPVRVELVDGSRLYGEFSGASDTEISLLLRENRSERAVPLQQIRVLWIADVRRARYQLFMAMAGLVGVGVAVGAGELLDGGDWVAGALGVAAVFGFLAGGWFAPPVRRWLVAWRRIYDGDHERTP